MSTLLGSTEVICVHPNLLRLDNDQTKIFYNEQPQELHRILSRVFPFPMCKQNYVCYININRKKYQRNEHRTQCEHYHTVCERKLCSHTMYVQLFPVITRIIQMKFITPYQPVKTNMKSLRNLHCYIFLLQVLL